MNYTLTATKRVTKGQKVRWQTGELPAVVYGAGKETESLSLKPGEFLKLFRSAGEASLIDLQLDGQDTGKVLVQDVQHDPVKGDIIHVDLRRIDMHKPMTATVELKFTGEAPVIKEQGGTLVMTVHTVEVKCLPKDLISHIDVDLTLLKNFDVVVKIKDLAVPAGIEITKPHAEDLVVKATRALTEDEIKALEEKNAQLDVSKIESAKPEKVEEGAEGPASATATAGKEAAGEKAPEAKKEEKK